MNEITQLHENKGVPIHTLCDALDIPRASYYRKQQKKSKTHQSSPSKNRKPSNALCDEEQQKILELLHGERFVDKTSYDIYHPLLDEGKYYCSPRTMYRILLSKNENKDR